MARVSKPPLVLWVWSLTARAYLDAGLALEARVSVVEGRAALEQDVARTPPPVAGSPAREPHAVEADAAVEEPAEDVVGEADPVHSVPALGARLRRVVLLGVDGEAATRDQVVADHDVVAVAVRVPDGDG